MIAGSLLLALALSAAAPDATVTETAPPSGRLLKFVGKQVSFDPMDCIVDRWQLADVHQDQDEYLGEVQVDSHADSAECNQDDLHYRGRYRVVHSIDGEADEAVDFFATGWTSHYAESHHALLYVLESPDRVLLPSGLAVSVYLTIDGEWASCDAQSGSEPLEFAGDLVFGRTDGMSPYGIAHRYPPSDYVILGEEAFCTRGRRLPALIAELDRELDDLRKEGFPNLP